MNTKVVPLREAPSLLGIAGQLEALASRIRNGEYGDVAVVATVVRSTDREPAVLSWGEGDSCRAFETLHLGAAWLLSGLDH